MLKNYTLGDWYEYLKMTKQTGSAKFLPKRSKRIKNKRRKRGKK